MANLSPLFNACLEKHNSGPLGGKTYSIDRINDFLKEAYQIVLPPHHHHICHNPPHPIPRL